MSPGGWYSGCAQATTAAQSRNWLHSTIAYGEYQLGAPLSTTSAGALRISQVCWRMPACVLTTAAGAALWYFSVIARSSGISSRAWMRDTGTLNCKSRPPNSNPSKTSLRPMVL